MARPVSSSDLVTILAVGVLLGSAATAGGQVMPVLIPQPKRLAMPGGTVLLRRPPECVVVLGAQATEPEKYAAQRLQTLVERRFGLRLPVVTEGKPTANAPQMILLGCRDTNERLDQLCRKLKLDLTADSPGHDGYVIEMVQAANSLAVVIGGCNPRGVIYGAQTFFRAIRDEGGQPSFPLMSVRDWPSIAWRGRPVSYYQAHLEPGVMEAYLWAGYNFIDVRDGPPRRRGQFGFPPGFKFNVEELTRCVTEAHRRGLFVWGTVSCGIKPDKFDAALKTFEELIGFGVDGLWISFDDPGGGEHAMDLVRRVIELGRQRGFTGRTIATTPPSGSYQKIDTDFNRQMVQVPGMENATWFFTRVPCRADREACKQLGLSRLPAWWHNWPRTEGGFTHGSYGGASFRVDKPSYMEVPMLTWGWHSPDYEKIRDAAENTDTVMQWGGWGQEYAASVLGVWAWEPARHDWEHTRQFIYETVFGRSLVETAREFDDRLRELRRSFLLPQRSPTPQNGWPPRLKPDADVAKIKQDLAAMDRLLKRLEEKAPQETLLTPQRLQTVYLEPMRAEWATAATLTDLPRPEMWWPEHEAAVFARLRAGDRQAVEKLCAEARPKLKQQLKALTLALQGLKGIDTYAAFWQARAAGGAEYWEQELQRRATAFQKRIEGLKAKGLDVDTMLQALTHPPAEGRPLATVSVEDIAASPVRFQGKWSTGLYTDGTKKAFVLSFPGHTASVPGDYVQVDLALPVPKFERHLTLQFFLNDEYDSEKWPKYRFYQWLHGDRVLWEEDIALTRQGGREWSSLDLTDLARGKQQLNLSLRLLDRRPVANYQTTIFVGELRLLEQ